MTDRPGDVVRAALNSLYLHSDASGSETVYGAVVALEKLVRRLCLKLERVHGGSIATDDARRLVDLDGVPLVSVEIREADRLPRELRIGPVDDWDDADA